MQSGLATRYAPSFRLIEAHFGLGLVGLVTFSTALLVRATEVQGFFFQPLLLGLVHLCVLGWLMPIAMGALHQLVPVVFEVPVRSERLAWVAFGLYALAVPLFITRMWTLSMDWLLPVGAVGAAAAIWLYVVNLYATLLRSRRPSLTGYYVMAALGWLLVAVTLGALLAANFYCPFLPLFHIALLRAHAHAAAFGFFGLLIMGVAYRLMEMFLLSHGAPERAGRIAFAATNVAVVVLVVSLAFGSIVWLLALGVGAALVGIGSFVLQVRAIYRRRTQRRIDVAWRHTASSLVYLGLSAALGAALTLARVGEPWLDRLHLVYGLFALVGFIGSIVVGQLYKIVPFLVWLHRFSAYVGLKRVPSASELLGERWKLVQYALMHAGIGALAIGVIVDLAPLRSLGASAFAGSAALVVRNLGVVWARKP